MCFPSGGSTSTNEFKPPSYVQQPWKDYVANAQQLASTPLQSYQGQLVAPITGMTAGGLQQLSDFTQQGTPERLAAGQAIVGAANGSASNPYGGMSNPYINQMIDTSNAKIADRYRTGTAAQNDASFARSGAFGGSAWQDQTSRNQQDLAGALAANTNNLLGNQYTNAQNIAESALNRSLTGAQLGIQQQGADQSAITAMIAGGQIPQKNYQDMLTANQNQFNQQQQAPFTLSDYLGNSLSRASGGQGSQTYTGPGQSPITGLLGAGALGYGLFGGG